MPNLDTDILIHALAGGLRPREQDRTGVSISDAEVLEQLLGAVETLALALRQLVHGLARG